MINIKFNRRMGAVFGITAAICSSFIPMSSEVAQAAAATSFPDYSTVDVGVGKVWDKSFFAPYVDATSWPPYAIADEVSKHGNKHYMLGFIVAANATTCSPSWGTYYSAEKGPLNTQIKSLRAMGGDVMVSFGGAANTALWSACQNTNNLKEQYKRFVDAYGLTNIDFDIEGASATDSASIDRNSKALAMLQSEWQAQGKQVKVWYTLPVLPTGLDSNGLSVVRSAIKYGVKLDGVNVMTMDYGNSAAPSPSGKMGQYGIQAITSLQSQLQSLYSTAGINKTDADLWAMVGTTPMIGKNDVQSEIFTLQDAQQTLDFAKQKGVGMIGFWSINRDAPCANGSTSLSDTCSSVTQQPYDFTKLFAAYNADSGTPSAGTGTGGTTGGGSTGGTGSTGNTGNTGGTGSTGGTETGNGTSVEWSSSTVYVAGDQVTYQGNTYQAKWWTQGNTPGAIVVNDWDTPWKLIATGSSTGSTGESTTPAVDTKSPTVPSGLAASAITSKSLTLSWTASSDNVGVTGYTVYQGGVQIGTSSGTSYAVSGLSAGTSYTYTVQAVDAAGNKSVASSEVTVTTTAASSGGTTTTAPTWDAAKVYVAGNQVMFQGHLFKAQWWTQGDQPDANAAHVWDNVWKLIQ